MLFSNTHVAIIMDGNGRWARSRGLLRTEGHRAGADAIGRTVEAAAEAGIGMLTLYAFSADNWKRPATETSILMELFHTFLESETQKAVDNGIRVSVIGRRDRLPLTLCTAIEKCENLTTGGTRMHLRLAVDYSSRDALLDAAAKLRNARQLSRELLERFLVGPDSRAASVDLMIRTGGDQRLSDFLLWECAYAELFFTPVMWPDFTASHLKKALDQFRRRERRFGALPEPALAG